MLEHDVVNLLVSSRKTLAVAESCTGGLLGGRITAVSGSSACFLGGFITYSNQLKTRLAGVPGELLERHGAVSREVAGAMAEGARRAAGADYAVSITGIAGPGGGTQTKPVGLVYIGLAKQDGSVIQKHVFPGDRDSVRFSAVEEALKLLLDVLEKEGE